MTEREAQGNFISQLLRHEDICRNRQRTWGDIHNSRGRVIDAENRYHAVRTLAFLERHGVSAMEIARLSVSINEATELTPTDGGS